jgi:hypothetical protein
LKDDDDDSNISDYDMNVLNYVGGGGGGGGSSIIDDTE